MEEKVKCKICGKIGLAKDYKGLCRHLRLAHNADVSKENCKSDYFEAAAPDSVIEIFSDTHKAYRKLKNEKWNKRNRKSMRQIYNSKEYVRIIYTPMKNG